MHGTLTAPEAMPERARLVLDTKGQRGADIGGLSRDWLARCAWFEGDGFDLACAGLPHTTIVVGYGSAPVERVDGRLAGRASSARPGIFTLIPAGEAHHYRCQGANRSFQIYLPQTLLTDLAASEGTGTELRDDRIFAADAALRAMIDSFGDRARRGATRLEMDARAVLIGIHILEHHGSAARAERADKAGLAPWQLRRVLDQIDQQPMAAIRLADLADSVGLSPYHFCRAFSRSTGLPPHSYMLRHKLERVRRLLAETDTSLAAIAEDVGCSDPAHLSRLFKRHFAMSPRDWRRQARDADTTET